MSQDEERRGCKVVCQSKDGNWFYRHSEPVWCMMSHHNELTCISPLQFSLNRLLTFCLKRFGSALFVLVEVNLIAGRVSSIEFGGLREDEERRPRFLCPERSCDRHPYRATLTDLPPHLRDRLVT